SASFEKHEVRLLAAGHLQRVRRWTIRPEALAIEAVDVQGKHGLDGTQAEWPAVFEEVDARGHERIDSEVQTGAKAWQAGLTELRPGEGEGEYGEKYGAAH